MSKKRGTAIGVGAATAPIIAAALTQVSCKPPHSELTNGLGDYELELPEGTWTLEFVKEGYAKITHEVVAGPASPRVRVDATLLLNLDPHTGLWGCDDQAGAVRRIVAIDYDTGQLSYSIYALPVLPDSNPVEALWGFITETDASRIVVQLSEVVRGPSSWYGPGSDEFAQVLSGFAAAGLGDGTGLITFPCTPADPEPHPYRVGDAMTITVPGTVVPAGAFASRPFTRRPAGLPPLD
jgi:hypothetical protein